MLNAEDYTHFRSTIPIVSVDLIVFNSEGKALLGKRLNEPARGSWFVPGSDSARMEKKTTYPLTRTSDSLIQYVA